MGRIARARRQFRDIPPASAAPKAACGVFDSFCASTGKPATSNTLLEMTRDDERPRLVSRSRHTRSVASAAASSRGATRGEPRAP